MRWNLNWDRYNNGGQVGQQIVEETPHSQIDSLIEDSDNFAPMNKLKQLKGIFPSVDSESLNKFKEEIYDGGDTLDLQSFNPGENPSVMDTLKTMKPMQPMQGFQFGGEVNPSSGYSPPIGGQGIIPGGGTGAPPPPGGINAFRGPRRFQFGGQALKYPAFNMPTDRTPNPKQQYLQALNSQTNPSESQGIPKTPPMTNLGRPPSQVAINRFRPKKKTPAGVPNPKPYNPFSQQMNTFG